ncbi:helix-turn-helix domain-containing protein, partial [Escherichia coli]|uniref:helix-turn-helix domain-containing protein n=1 Tax=Escherichia coli TaxID=562 RepID=UPI0031F63169|nr:hypothetical protein [Escherichia coli]
TVCVVGKIRDLILQLSKSSIYSTKPVGILINAAEELRSTTESVTTITFKYQFDFQQTFTRAFTRRFGIAPIAYRKLAKEEVRWNS